MYKEATPAFELSVEMGTDSVPDDGQYHVLFQGRIIASAPTQKKGIALYKAQRERLLQEGWELPRRLKPDAEEILAKQRFESDMLAMRSDWFSGRAKQSGRGGRGGRGGV